MKDTKLLFLMLATLVVTSVRAETVDMCKQVAMSINHPAEYATEKVRKKSKWHCLALPHCCTPGWVGDPACYVVKRKKVKDAWQETKNTVNCKRMSVQQGVSEFFGTIGQPAYHLTGGFYSAYRNYLDLAIAASRPIPGNIRNKLLELRYHRKLPARFHRQDIDQARWIRSDEPHGVVLFPGTYGRGQTDAITHDKLIVVKSKFFRGHFCSQVGLWAHELVHVAQMREKGHVGFLRDYIQQATHREYRSISYEEEAYRTEDIFRRDCLRAENT